MNHESDQTSGLDIEKFEELFNKNHQFLCMVAFKVVNDHFLAEDLVQEFFIKYWEKKSSMQLTVSFEAFAYRSIKNSCLDYLRKQSVIDKHLSKIVLEAFDMDTESMEIPKTDQRLRKVLQLLNELPPDRRKVFELHAVERLTYKQIADQLGVSVNTVKTQLRRAYSKLRGKAIVILILSYLIKSM